MKARFENWLSRWRLRRIIAALNYATDYGLRTEVADFVKSLEATALMARGLKKDAKLTITCEREQLNSFISYMTKLHTSKLSLRYRACIGLAALAVKDKHVLGETPEAFVSRELPKAKTSKDNNRIIKLTK